MIRKTISNQRLSTPEPGLDLASIASFEISSEHQDHLLENALKTDRKRWEAAEPGEQKIRISFDNPQTISRIAVVFEEEEIARTQEFALFWQTRPGSEWQEVLRQQFNFSPPATTLEREDYKVSLHGASGIEIWIKPDISGHARASLTQISIS
jgi:hypothetical protein